MTSLYKPITLIIILGFYYMSNGLTFLPMSGHDLEKCVLYAFLMHCIHALTILMGYALAAFSHFTEVCVYALTYL